MRGQANTESNVTARLMKNYIIADYVSQTGTIQEITIFNNKYQRDWTLLKLGSLQSYIYGLFVEKFDTRAQAEEFVSLNRGYNAIMKGQMSMNLSKLDGIEYNYGDDEKCEYNLSAEDDDI